MSKKPKKPKNDKPEEDDSFGLDMDFEEALERFLGVKPEEVRQNRPKPDKSKSKQGAN